MSWIIIKPVPPRKCFPQKMQHGSYLEMLTQGIGSNNLLLSKPYSVSFRPVKISEG